MILSSPYLFNQQMAETEVDLGAWAALRDGFHPSGHIAKGWLRGLGANRAAPAEVLVSLFDAERASFVRFLYRADLPTGVLDAAGIISQPG